MEYDRKKEKWVLSSKRADFYKIGEQFQIDPVIARLIRNRDIMTDEDIKQYLHPSLSYLHEPNQLKHMQEATTFLIHKIKNRDKIRIISDYDVDGIMSNYILLKGFQTIGANVDYEIPDRMKDGYGINERIVLEAYEQGVDTIVTCDNGIAAYEQIAYAKSFGLHVIVTDHHDVPYEEEVDGSRMYKIPPADYVINPKQADCPYPFPKICGATVAFKLIQSLYKAFGIEERIKELIEFSAIATVCDVVDLQGENRILVKEGLKRLNQTKNIGLQALIQANHLEEKTLSAYHLGFVIGPCLNASGRLDTAKRGLQLLLEEDRQIANRMAKEVKELNDARKDMTEQGVRKAIEQVETTSLLHDKVLVIYLPDCHESLAGIIAGRVRETFAKPVFVLTNAEEGLKGSGRSIEAYSMYEELSKCKTLLSKFGGHPMAAGLSLPKENLEAFREMLNQNTTLTDEDLVEKVVIDVPMPICYINESLIEQLDLLEPFGKGNNKPLFAQKQVHLLMAKVLGKNRNVLKFLLESEDKHQIEALYFGNIDVFMEKIKSKYGQKQLDYLLQGRNNKITMNMTYYPSINEFGGNRTLQIFIQHYQFC